MAWKIEFDSKAVKDLEKLNKTAQKQIVDYLKNRIAKLVDPRSSGKPLKGRLRGIWRYRIEDYRVLCKIEDTALIIIVIAVAHRSKVYDG